MTWRTTVIQHRDVLMHCLTICWYLTDSWLWLSQHAFLAFLTSVPLYVHPGWSFRSSGNCKWSASFSSQVTLLFSIDGPMLTDTHLLSMTQRCSHGVYIPIERFKKMWLSRRLPSTGGTNLRRRQSPAKKPKRLVKFWNRCVERDREIQIEFERGKPHFWTNWLSIAKHHSWRIV